MTLELRPLGVACNIACTYCYQDPQRDAGNVEARYSLDAMKAAAERREGPVTLFGGEPLMLRMADLTELLRWAAERPGGVGIQTNGTLITDAHIELFRTYQVQVGISVDGPDELNDLRRQGTLERTRAATSATHDAIARLAREHRPPGLIVTLHRTNAAADRLPRLLAWARDLDRLGIRSMRLHLLEVDGPAARAAALTDEENIAALTAFEDLSSELTGLRIDVVDETRAALRGADEHSSCVWRGCDPYTTPAVQGIEGDGRSSNCGRTNKDGVDFGKADRHAFDRPLALYTTPQADGGCAGCRFFLACRGQCPGTAVGGDWRNRSEQCAVWTAMFVRAEAAVAAEGLVPVSVDPRRPELERRLVEHWRRGSDASTALLLHEIDAQDWNAGTPAAQVALDTRFAAPPRISFSSGPDRGRTVLAAAREASWRAAVASVAAGHEETAVVAPGGAGALAVRLAAAEQDLHARVLRDGPGGGLGDSGLSDDRPGPLLLIAAHPYPLFNAGESAPDHRACPCGRSLPLPAPVPGPALWLAHGNTAGWRDPNAEVVDVPAAGLNLLWRSLGIGLTDLLPCGPHCPAARDRAARRHAAARAAGVDLDALDEVLAWPAQWSALHGIAELRAPLLRLTHPTVYTAGRVEIRFAGSAYPEDGAVGLNFPYRRPPSARHRATLPLVSVSAPAGSRP